MRAFARIGAAALVLACGGAEVPPTPAPDLPDAPAARAAGAGGEPPLVAEARIRPEQPQTGDTLSLVLRAYDPERERLEYEVEWIRNGRSLPRAAALELRVPDLRRGEQISARVYVSDGHHEVVQNVEPVRVHNRPPLVASVRLLPERPSTAEPLLADATVRDDDGDVFELAYAWYVNDKQIDDAREASLPTSSFKRGDRVRVEVVASDRENASEPGASRTLQVRNAIPRIDSQPVRSVEDQNRYRYQIVASDPDGDRPLRYELQKGPTGMSVDLMSGELIWSVADSVSGPVDIEVSVADAYGAKTTQAWTLDLAWDDVPAAAVEAAPAKAAVEAVPDEAAVEAAPDAAAVEAVPDEAAVEVAPDEAAVEVAPDEAAVEVAPDAAAVEAVPDEAAVEVAPDEAAVEAVPDEAAVEVAPDEAAVEAVPDEAAGEAVPAAETQP